MIPDSEFPGAMSAMTMTGVEAFLEVLSAAGVTYIFGNPGTTELPIYDALAVDRRFRCILGLHEVPVVAMADGYAQASGSVGVANVHICCGLGNAMGMLYNAHIAGSPVILTAGQQDRRLRFEEPVLFGDMVSVTRPWTRWSAEVQRVEEVPSAVRRAVQTALTPPTGPVFLALPLDVQQEASDRLDLAGPQVPDRRLRPACDAIRRGGELLASARKPVILAGSRVTESDAVSELVAVAQRLGAPVISEAGTAHGRLPFPSDHPLYADSLPLWSPDVRQKLAGHDVILIVGMPVLKQYLYHEPARPIPERARLVQIDCNPWEIGKNYPVEAGLAGDIKTTLAELEPLLARLMTDEQKRAASERIAQHGSARQAMRQAVQQKIAEQWQQRPVTPLALMGAIARVLPTDAVVVEEAVTTTNMMLEKLGILKDPRAYFGHRGWALGWALGAALGVKLAWPDRPVLCLLGDGSTMYGIQGLWTAAHHRIPVTFIICNNAEYRILKVCGNVMQLPRMTSGKYLAMDLIDPRIDFVGLAQSLGVEACRIESADELADRLPRSLAGDRPQVFEVMVGTGESRAV
jgi:benzoylformate decarboxylase